MQQNNGINLRTIILTSAELFAKNGYRAASLTDVAAKLGVTKPALYYYVKSKNEILWLIFEEIMGIYLNFAMSIIEKKMDPRERLRCLIEIHAYAVLNNKSFSIIFFRDKSELTNEKRQILNQKLRKYERLFEDAYKDGVNQGIFKPFDSHAVISGIFGMVNSLYQSHNESDSISPKEIVDIYLQLFEGGYINN